MSSQQQQPGTPSPLASPSTPAHAGSGSGTASPTIPDRPSSPELPLTMTASTLLHSLPHDATAALEAAGKFDIEKVRVRFKPIGSAPSLRSDRQISKIAATQKFEAITIYLRKWLKIQPTETLFLYINNTFAPALDEVVGNLHQCFKDSSNQLNVSYSLTPAFG